MEPTTCWICTTCGVQHQESVEPPPHCAICDDERQYVGWNGQEWISPAELRRTHRAELREEEPGLLGIGCAPHFAIGQRALLIRTPGGNILWDCTPLLDDEIHTRVVAAGGIAAIVISHPHFYGAMVEWGRTFDAPVLLPRADSAWVMRSDPCIELWDGDTLRLLDGLQVIRCGGHFAGAAVLHWPQGAGGRGALLVGDTIMVARDRRQLSFMRSYPNLIPLSMMDVRRIAGLVEPLQFDRIWSGWWSSAVLADAKRALRDSVARYERALSELAD